MVFRTTTILMTCVVLVAFTFQTARASEPAPRTFTRRAPAVTQPVRLQRVPIGYSSAVPRRSIRPASVVVPQQPADQALQAPTTAGYARLNSPLYPSPLQNIPIQLGGTVISNPALAPHEYLYAHEYRALYPPYYYRVRGSWIWTPFGMESHDKWELLGTRVRVRYVSDKGLLQRLATPFIEPLID